MKKIFSNGAVVVIASIAASIACMAYFTGAFTSTNAELAYTFVRAEEFSIASGTTTVGGVGTVNATLQMKSSGTRVASTETFTEIGLVSAGTGPGINAARMSTASDLRRVTTFPRDYDNAYPMAVRFFYTSSSDDDDGAIIWKFHTIPLTLGAGYYSSGTTYGNYGPRSFTDINATNVSRIYGWDTVAFAADSSTVAWSLRTTNWDTVKVDSLRHYSSGQLWLQGVECDADGGASSSELAFVGMEIAYVKKGVAAVRPDSVAVPGPRVGGVNKGIWLKKRAKASY